MSMEPDTKGSHVGVCRGRCVPIAPFHVKPRRRVRRSALPTGLGVISVDFSVLAYVPRLSRRQLVGSAQFRLWKVCVERSCRATWRIDHAGSAQWKRLWITVCITYGSPVDIFPFIRTVVVESGSMSGGDCAGWTYRLRGTGSHARGFRHLEGAGGTMFHVKRR